MGYEINGTSCLGDAACAYVLGGLLYLNVASATEGAYISSSPSDGAGAGGWDLPVNGAVEMRMYVPGPSSSLPYNWGGYFCSGQDWPHNGEGDVVETNEYGIDVNYHYYNSGEQQSGPYNPSGNWCNSWHVYTMVRLSSTLQFWWDGVMVKEWSTDDEGGAWSILPNCGTGGGPTAYNTPIQASYCRGWVAAPGLGSRV